MPFCNEDSALIKLIPVQTIQFLEDADDIFEDKLQKGRTGHITFLRPERFGKQETLTKGMRAAD